MVPGHGPGLAQSASHFPRLKSTPAEVRLIDEPAQAEVDQDLSKAPARDLGLRRPQGLHRSPPVSQPTRQYGETIVVTRSRNSRSPSSDGAISSSATFIP
jgi:hypothetical protein